jgi:hypothetical protein
MLHAALNKMLHEPSKRLKQAAVGGSDEAEQLASALNELFQLDCPVERPSGDRPNASVLDDVDATSPAPGIASTETSPSTPATSTAPGPTRPEAHEAN